MLIFIIAVSAYCICQAISENRPVVSDRGYIEYLDELDREDEMVQTAPTDPNRWTIRS